MTEAREGYRAALCIKGTLGKSGANYVIITDDSGTQYLVYSYGGSIPLQITESRYWPPLDGDIWSASPDSPDWWYARNTEIGNRKGLRMTKADTLGVTILSTRVWQKNNPYGVLVYRRVTE